MVADRPFGEFYDFYSDSPEYFGYTLVQSEGKLLVKGTFVLGYHFLCTTSPQDRSTVTLGKWTFLMGTYILLCNCVFEVSSLQGCEAWQVVLGVFKGHSFFIFSVQESKLDPLTLMMKAVQSLEALGTTHPTMQCHVPADLNLGKVNFFHEFLFFPPDALSHIF
jgi:hypothetical protein